MPDCSGNPFFSWRFGASVLRLTSTGSVLVSATEVQQWRLMSEKKRLKQKGVHIARQHRGVPMQPERGDAFVRKRLPPPAVGWCQSNDLHWSCQMQRKCRASFWVAVACVDACASRHAAQGGRRMQAPILYLHHPCAAHQFRPADRPHRACVARPRPGAGLCPSRPCAAVHRLVARSGSGAASTGPWHGR